MVAGRGRSRCSSSVLAARGLRPAAAGRRAAGRGATPRELSRRRPEQRRGVGRGAGSASNELFSGWAASALAAHGHNPLAYETAAGLIELHRHSDGGLTSARLSARSSWSERPGCRPTASPGANWSRGRTTTSRQRLGVRPGEPGLVRGPGAARARVTPWRRRRTPGCSASRTPTEASASPGPAPRVMSMTPGPRSRRSAVAGAAPHGPAGRRLIRAHQDRDGGFPSEPGDDSMPSRPPGRCRA